MLKDDINRQVEPAHRSVNVLSKNYSFKFNILHEYTYVDYIILL